MKDWQKPNERTSLVHWTYSREEWNTFMRWKKMKRGFFYYLLHRLSQNRNLKTPEIIITPNRVSIDNNHESFHDTESQFKRINIHDTGNINVIEISYQRKDAQSIGLSEIYIPVPKGHLKEAIEVEVKLNAIKEA
jgi:hypothetical protein